MSKYKELVYMVLDKLKLASDDAQFNEDHVIFLLDKYRAFLLKQRYADIKKPVPESNYQTICLDLIQVPAISGEPCEGGIYLRSKDKVPSLMKVVTPRVFPIDYYQGEITFVSKERMRYVGYNKYLQNIIYCSIGPDGYLYFKSYNPQYLYLKKVKMRGIFYDSNRASELQCPDEEGNVICDIMDRNFSIEDSLVPPLLELVIKDLISTLYHPDDEDNNAKDDLVNIKVNK